MNKEIIVNVIGAGLAGSEAAYQLIKRGIKVRLYEMRGVKNTEAHVTANFAELICSNSLRAKAVTNAVGLLKEEMNQLDSLIMKAAYATEVEAGGALAVDRVLFSEYVTKYLKNSELVEFVNEEVTKIPEGYTIIASGPLTSPDFSKAIQDFCGEDYLYFFDSVAPIVTEKSINKDIAYLKSRYDKGEASYFNCPMNKEQFENFYNELIHAERVIPHEFELKVFEGCMAIEDMASRGEKTLLFGPMKPVGLETKDGKRPFAVVQLRQDNKESSLYNIVGFQTNLKWGEQSRVFKLIPGLENATIYRYGVMHRNTFINAPKHLTPTMQLKNNKNIFIAGQLSGVEGYIESSASGIVAAINAVRLIKNEEPVTLPIDTVIGALLNYICTAQVKSFQPMNSNYGILANRSKDKMEVKDKSLNCLKEWIDYYG